MTASAFDWNEMPKDQKANPEDSEVQLWGSAVQLGLRLSGRHSHMLGLVRDWLAKQSLIEYEGNTGVGPEVARTDTTLARFILESAIENLYADYELDKLIDHAADLWSEQFYDWDEVDGTYPRELENPDVVRQLKEGSNKRDGIGQGYPGELIERIVRLGKERLAERGAGEMTSLVDGQRLMARMNKNYSKPNPSTESLDDSKQELDLF